MSDSSGMDRRDAIKWMLSAAGSVALLDHDAFAQVPAPPAGAGYGVDPNLLKTYKPGDLWPLALNANPSGIACEQPGIELEPGLNLTSSAPPRLRAALAVQVASGNPASSMLVILRHGSTEVSRL